MAYTANTCTENADISDTKIEDMYPEILISNPTYDSGEADDSLLAHYEVATDIAMTMDILATVGRSYYTITLVEKDHGPVLKDYLAASVANGYTVNYTAEIVTVACGSC
jgi:hypothetical protein